ncbi:hypothetical protein O1L44_18625 [Streptomyces noursei]|uniref:hypothetical protein n=1 Tax=Streptomyces noursei TaxID=1971 RepID=UPI00081C4B83|nr:hypothetical protein SNOUR_23095 [Streptomyces noursei ATCC 11455]MCZ0994735.1 hypothetical protein [Streptomyces noursei]
MTADTPFPTSPSTPASSPAGFRVDVFPDVRRPDAGAVLIGEWDTGGPERQRAVMDGVARAWAEAPLPDGLLSRVLFTGTDGRNVLNYGQWTSHAARREFLRTGAAGLTDRLAAVLDGVGGVGTGGPGTARSPRTSTSPRTAPGSSTTANGPTRSPTSGWWTPDCWTAGR